jgi:hypothetical protein
MWLPASIRIVDGRAAAPPRDRLVAVSASSAEDRELDKAVPEADALEQRRDVSEEEELNEAPHIGNEVPEADALDQARAVPLDEDDERDAG